MTVLKLNVISCYKLYIMDHSFFKLNKMIAVEPLFTDTSLILTPLYYRQFLWSWQNAHALSLNQSSIPWSHCTVMANSV